MRLRNYRFRPRPLPTLLTLLLLTVLVSLGLWQLQRGEDKQAIWTLQERNAGGPPVMLSERHRDAQGLLGTPVRVQGRWDGQRQVLLVNQTHQGRPGFEVYTPLLLQGGDVGVLVDRGWVPHDLTRSAVPDPEVASGTVSLLGVVDKPPSIGLKLGDGPAAGRQGWPRRVQYLDLEWVQAQLGYPLLPFVVLHLEGDPIPLARGRDPAQVGKGGMPPEKHRSYAVQWFALATALVVLFVAVNLSRAEDSEEDRT